jgi:endoglycosylceramidase
MCAEYNISVLLDAHQDLLSRKFCGEGAPDWAVFTNKTFPYPIKDSIKRDANGYPI